MKLVSTVSALCLLLAPAVAFAAPATTGSTGSAASSTHNTAAANQYSSEATAKQSCGSSPVVWVNKSSKAIHPSGDKYYGKTKSGAYMCQNVAEQAGYHMPGPSKTTKVTAKKS